MSPGLLHILLLLALLVLMGLGGMGLLISSGQKQKALLDARIDRATRITAPRKVVAAAPVALAAVRSDRTIFSRALMIFGCDYAERGIYRLPWWVVLLVTLLVARIATMICAVLLGKLAWIVLPPIWLIGSRTLFGQWRDKHRDIMFRQFPDALAMIIRAVRVGVPVPEAMRIVAREAQEPTRAEFLRLSEDIAIGTPLDVALRASAARTALPEYGFFAATLSLQAQAGGGLSESLELLADTIRKRVALKARGFALTSESRSSTMVLGSMPFLMTILLFFVNPSYILVLFITHTGQKLLVVGILLLTVALFIMRNMIKGALK
ncbi:type II secretion system F family protein [Acidisoma silvae]|uniref:Type II secretion system F family protein n=1 Tax=Acidisoma silvae TaxID=2802396 RepID=A0A964DZ99_9PROT|nr:type II secretion system F family protein [Acidisoma silvae]MCB8875897.1 type II secretion system F family protein [Acidisoma silvae]